MTRPIDAVAKVKGVFVNDNGTLRKIRGICKCTSKSQPTNVEKIHQAVLQCTVLKRINSIMAIIANLYIDQGTDYSITVDCTDSAGEVLDLTGYTAAAQMRKTYSSSTVSATFLLQV